MSRHTGYRQPGGNQVGTRWKSWRARRKRPAPKESDSARPVPARNSKARHAMRLVQRRWAGDGGLRRSLPHRDLPDRHVRNNLTTYWSTRKPSTTGVAAAPGRGGTSLSRPAKGVVLPRSATPFAVGSGTRHPNRKLFRAKSLLVDPEAVHNRSRRGAGRRRQIEADPDELGGGPSPLSRYVCTPSPSVTAAAARTEWKPSSNVSTVAVARPPCRSRPSSARRPSPAPANRAAGSGSSRVAA